MLKKLLSVLFIGALTNSLFAISTCSDVQNLETFNGHYYGVSDRRMTFNEAKLFAEQKGGYLAIPNSAAENNFIKGVLGGNGIGWIGVYDPSFSTNYGEIQPDRFKDIKGNALSYSNWNYDEPNNVVLENDVIDGVQRISPLGEHWGVIDAITSFWADEGNHFSRGEARHYAIMEFDSVPECYKDISTTVTDTFTNKRCSTQIWDDKTGNLETAASNLDCQTDEFGNTYCPSAVAPCAQEWDYDDGYSVAEIGQVVDFALKEKQFKCPANNYLLTNKYFDSCGHCIDRTYYEVRCSTNGTVTVLHEFRLKGNNAYGGGRVIQTYNQSNIGSNVGQTYLGNIGQGCNYLIYYSRTCDGVNCTYKFNINSNCNGSSYSTNTVAPIPYIFSCPSGYTETTGTETAKGQCKKTIEYTYYNYLCSPDKNSQGFGWETINSGGNCNKTDTNNTTNDSSILDDACNSATPPTNNCKREKFMCQANKDRPCSFIDEQWQCSPFPCFGNDDIEVEGDIEGKNDKKDNGWNSDGSCGGQLYIFNGEDYRCRSSDTFFGLTGGGCCDKDKVFMGLIACKEKEKKLAEKAKKELCVQLGEYCSKKINLGFKKVCVQKSKGNCCFGSKLARVIHEQGRPQLPLGWGSGDSPICRGFTIEEFQKLDFSKIDLSNAIDISNMDINKGNNRVDSAIENIKNMYGGNNE